MKLLLHVLMLSLLSGGSAEVVDDFEQKCRQCFAGGKSPTTLSGSQYKQICQRLNGVVYYATYYDTSNKIPVYSAYKFNGKTNCKRKKNWYIEPQLDDNNGGPNMASEGSVNIKLRGKHQALNDDYVNSGYDKGHLAPVSHARSQICSDATFTLTNAAPQNPSFNQGQWRVIEGKIADLSKECLAQQYSDDDQYSDEDHYSLYQNPKNSVYIVTGVVPGKDKIKEKVKVPSYFWTAFCCLDQNEKCQTSGGFIGENKKNTKQSNTMISVDELERELAELYDVREFNVFAERTKIQNHEFVGHFFPWQA